jgi:acetyl-CoA carboxylase biotin carboxyl carrier protein
MAVQVEAQVTGRVVRVEKQVGDQVETEDVLLVLESMKMEIPVEAESAGKIAEILVAEGDSVAEGDVLVVLD